MSILALILIAYGAMILVMSALWLVQRGTQNAGIVDVAWSFGTGIIAAWFAFGANGDPSRRWLIAIIAGLWSVRLGVYLTRRMIGAHEDRRYTALREKWGDRTPIYMFAVFQIQAFWAVLFALPMLLAATNGEPGLRWYDALGVAIWLGSIIGESVADGQLNAFRAEPDNRGRVCSRGIWRYSRHPNYFFEWFHWWAYVAIGFTAPHGWLTLLGPALMFVFLTKITGIPITERALVESRGEAYRRYQRTTSALIPLPPKQESSS